MPEFSWRAGIRGRALILNSHASTLMNLCAKMGTIHLDLTKPSYCSSASNGFHTTHRSPSS